jgi:hypothetical protein
MKQKQACLEGKNHNACYLPNFNSNIFQTFQYIQIWIILKLCKTVQLIASG